MCEHNNIVWDAHDLKECRNVMDCLGIPCICQDCGAKLIEWYCYSNTEEI